MRSNRPYCIGKANTDAEANQKDRSLEDRPRSRHAAPTAWTSKYPKEWALAQNEGYILHFKGICSIMLGTLEDGLHPQTKALDGPLCWALRKSRCPS